MSEVEMTPVEELVPKAAFVHYQFGLDDHLKFTQRPLSFFGKIEVFGALGGAVEKALQGGLSLGEILEDVPDSKSSVSEFAEADQFIKSIARLVQYAPDFLKELYVISLGVPSGERDYVKMIMELPEDEGGLSDDQGIQILETFVSQNWDVLLDFFTKKILPVFNKMTKSDPESVSSKPSKATRRPTQKQ